VLHLKRLGIYTYQKPYFSALGAGLGRGLTTGAVISLIKND
jgi:hypothetical protein